eukprot:CAMPEP_0202860426 /NCGR_PEP_ID=MMETSP1391-20130828/2131_1 /ASSEMBLY_ACC=CAM_ASM_000867 /TAXON_ID=1034604 /ORGANISM="Chlamydomonas leiostraca, Strain SAG 11-49" /LENGTH=639 /DNA_ID=CAMNT_0049539585 /DNA_START=145 /DNA_END=2064 /DNA_ORIENTATION=-
MQLTLDNLRTAFHLPREQAAATLGVTLNELKKALKVLKIERWPFRKLASLDALRQDLEEQLGVLEGLPGDNQSTIARIKDTRARIEDDMAKIRHDPNYPIEEDLHKLRLHNYKARFQRQHNAGSGSLPKPLPSPKTLALAPSSSNASTQGLQTQPSGGLVGRTSSSGGAPAPQAAGQHNNQSVTLNVLPSTRIAANGGVLASLGSAPATCMAYSAPLYDANAMDVDAGSARYTSLQQVGGYVQAAPGSTPPWMRPLHAQQQQQWPQGAQHHMDAARYGAQPLPQPPLTGVSAPPPVAVPPHAHQQQARTHHLGATSQPLPGAGRVKLEWPEQRMHSAAPAGWPQAGHVPAAPAVEPKATPLEEMLDVLMTCSSDAGWQQATQQHAQHPPGGNSAQLPLGHTTVTTGLQGVAPAAPTQPQQPQGGGFQSNELFGGLQQQPGQAAPEQQQYGPHTVAAFEAHGPVIAMPGGPQYFQLSAADKEEEELLQLLGLPTPRAAAYTTAPAPLGISYAGAPAVAVHPAAPQHQQPQALQQQQPGGGWAEPVPQQQGQGQQHPMASAPLYYQQRHLQQQHSQELSHQQQQQAMYEQYQLQQRQHQLQQQGMQGYAAPAPAANHAAPAMQQQYQQQPMTMDLRGIWDV